MLVFKPKFPRFVPDQGDDAPAAIISLKSVFDKDTTDAVNVVPPLAPTSLGREFAAEPEQVNVPLIV
jgi:hypothetical protein